MNRAGIVELIADGVGLRAGDKVSVFMTDSSVIDLTRDFVELCYRRGACPQVLLTDEHFDQAGLRYAGAEKLAQPPPLEAAAMAWCDVHVSFRAMVPPPSDAPDPVRAAALRTGRGVISTMRWQGTRWALVRVPTPEWAARFGLDFKAWQDEWEAAFEADWPAAGRRMQALCEILDGGHEVVLRSRDTDLRMGIAGRRWVPFAGQANWPDGEIATAPLETTAQGHIVFPGELVFGVTVVRDLALTFEQGRVVALSAGQGQAFVEQLLDDDAGARLIGEFGVGTNARLQTVTHDLLIDEKILGTAHIALGRAYPECGGVNQSAIHWDIVKDLRQPGGYLSVDGTVLIEDGVVTPLLADAAVGNAPSRREPSN